MSARIAVLALMVASSAAYAQTDSERISELQNQVEALQRRVTALEGGTRESSASAPAIKQGNPEDIRNWRQLRVGMKEQQVEALLGSPSKVDMYSHQFIWYYNYPLGGHISFDSESRVVKTWNEP